jgi:hypothetical protein
LDDRKRRINTRAVVGARACSVFEVIDAQTLRRIKDGEGVVANKDGDVGVIVAVLGPGLRRRGEPGQGSLQLTKAKIMVDLFSPLPKKRRVA